MTFIELHLQTSDLHTETLSNQLTLLGAEAITLKDSADEPIYEPTDQTPRVWPSTTLIALFQEANFSPAILTYLATLKKDGLLNEFNWETLPDEDWVRRSLDGFKPTLFGTRLWVYPSWEIPTTDPHLPRLILDPGLAFGTGSHPTTALCLEWLDQANLHGLDIIDYGCGSGILGIAALKLGAKQVSAVDHDSQAIEATRANAAQNNVTTDQLNTYRPEDLPKNKVDLILANILCQPLISLAPTFKNHLRLGGKIVLSGILLHQTDLILETYKPHFDLQPIVSKGEWVLICGQVK